MIGGRSDLPKLGGCKNECTKWRNEKQVKNREAHNFRHHQPARWLGATRRRSRQERYSFLGGALKSGPATTAAIRQTWDAGCSAHPSALVGLGNCRRTESTSSASHLTQSYSIFALPPGPPPLAPPAGLAPTFSNVDGFSATPFVSPPHPTTIPRQNATQIKTPTNRFIRSSPTPCNGNRVNSA